MIPAVLAEDWKQAHRLAAIQAMALSAELKTVTALLEEAGLAPIALKGAWLAWHAYPAPALRPMRDLDLLLDADTAIAAFELLKASGYRAEAVQELALEDVLRLEKHMPALIGPRGVVIELHQRLWEIDGRMDHAAPAGLGGNPRDRAVRQGDITCLSATDMLAHLIIHASYDHRLDCGPLLLFDIAFLLRREAVDWHHFWAIARTGNWQRGARLVLKLVANHDPTVPMTFPPDLPVVPSELLQSAPDLLLQDLASRQSAGVMATARAAGPLRFVQRIMARRGAAADHSTTARDLSGEGGYFSWAANRLIRTLKELSRRDVRRQSGNLARLSLWLDS